MLNNSAPDVQNNLSSKVFGKQAEESHQSSCFISSDQILNPFSPLSYDVCRDDEMLLSEEPMLLLGMLTKNGKFGHKTGNSRYFAICCLLFFNRCTPGFVIAFIFSKLQLTQAVWTT